MSLHSRVARFDHVGAHGEAVVGGEAQVPGQVDVFLQGLLGRFLEVLHLLGSLEGTRVDHGHRDEDEVLVEVGEVADDRQDGVDAEAVVAADQLDGGHLLGVRLFQVGLAAGGDVHQQVVQLAHALSGPCCSGRGSGSRAMTNAEVISSVIQPPSRNFSIAGDDQDGEAEDEAGQVHGQVLFPVRFLLAVPDEVAWTCRSPRWKRSGRR